MDPALRTCVQLALAGPRLVAPPEPAASPPLTVSTLGMHLHAATTVDGRDRKRLERVCRYLLRPPFARSPVTRAEDHRHVSDSTTHPYCKRCHSPRAMRHVAS